MKKSRRSISSFAVRKTIIIMLIVWLIVSAAGAYIGKPAWNLASPGFWGYLMFSLGLLSLLMLLEMAISSYEDNDITKFHVFIWIATGGIIVVFLILALISAPLFQVENFKSVAEVEEGIFEEDFQDISNDSQYVLLDVDTASRLGDRVLGSIPNAAWYEVSQDYNLIIYKGKQYRISPLQYGGFFQYNRAKATGIPGYVLVDAETLEAKFVETSEHIRFSPSAFFSNELKRHIRSQFPSLVFDQFSFEINDEGTPYWIASVYTPNAGVWGACTIDSCVIVNACTGEMELYSIEEKPEWVDHVQSVAHLMKMIYWKYEYINGIFNFSKTGVVRTTYQYADQVRRQSKESGIEEPYFYGYSTFVNSKGEVVIFTGVTPANRTESNVGFLCINASTGRYTYYNTSGAEESSSQGVVEGLIQNMGYQATYPFMINVNGVPTYLMNMKDKSGLIQRYALVNYANYKQAFVGDTFAETLTGYMKLLGIKASFVPIETDEESVMNVRGEIFDIREAVIDGTTYYYYLIGDSVYRASITVNENQVFFKTGDKVEVSYVPNESTNINVIVGIK